MKRRNSYYSVIAGLAGASLITACGPDPKSVGLKDDAARQEFYYPGQTTETSDSWNALADFMGMGNLTAKSEEELIADLVKPPAIFSTTGITAGENLTAEQINANAFFQAVAGKLIQSAIQGQCADVVGLTEARPGYFLDAEGKATKGASNFHVMQYKLRAADGKAEDLVRQALISIPAAGSDVPLVMYGHSQASGLVYEEIAQLFGAFQAKAVIAAPSFPGELITSCTPENEDTTCAKNIGDDSFVLSHPGTQEAAAIFADDAREILGLHNCILSLFYHPDLQGKAPELDKKTYKPTGNVIDAFGQLAKFTKDFGNGNIALPYTVFAGIDRGAFAVQLAAARQGFINGDIINPASKIGELWTKLGFDISTFARSFPQGVLVMGSHSSLTMGFNRIALQLMVQDLIDTHAMGQLPGFSKLGELFAEFGSTYSDELSDEEALLALANTSAEIAIRDLSFMGRYLPIAVRNWKGEYLTEGGNLANLHGIHNKAVAYSQAQIADGIWLQVNDAIKEGLIPNTPALNHHVFAFQAPEDSFDEDGVLKDLNHVGDESFLKGQLVGLEAAHLGVISGKDNTAADATIDILAAGIEAATSKAVPKQAVQATLYPLNKRSKDYKAFDPSSDEEATPLDKITPSAIAAGWLSYHGFNANPPTP